MRPNKYIYPYIPFHNLSNKRIRNNIIGSKHISIKKVRSLVRNTSFPVFSAKGKTVAERIFSIFEHDEIRFGPVSYISSYKHYWLSKLQHFIDRKEPIQFLLLGFPFKIPVPLKTRRTLPDMGEALALERLRKLGEAIKKMYRPGAVITIFTEGAFGSMVGVGSDVVFAYKNALVALNKLLRTEHVVRIRELAEMEKSVKNFTNLHKKQIALLKKLYAKRDPAFMKKYRQTYESMYRIVSTKGYPESVLCVVYNKMVRDSKTTSPVRLIRSDIKKRARHAVFQYHAYLLVRDEINFLETAIPHGLHLSVSPKPARLGIIPVHAACTRLPYHGVPVRYPGGTFLLEYLIDIERRKQNYIEVFLKGDKDRAPFYFESNAQC